MLHDAKYYFLSARMYNMKFVQTLSARMYKHLISVSKGVFSRG